MSAPDVAALGETMLRLSVPAGHRLRQARSFDAHVGGAESNVLAGLAALGRRCAYASRVADDELGAGILARLREAGIDVNAVERVAGGRTGLYFVEFGAGPRHGQVIYDRAGSAAASLEPDAVRWEPLAAARIVHVTGITPALSEGCARATAELIARRRRSGTAWSFDVNHRARLWSPSRAAAWIDEHIRAPTVLLCGRADAATLFGLSGSDEEVAHALGARFDAEATVLTLGEEGALVLAEGTTGIVPAPRVEVVDRIGAGDAFAAGVLDGWLDGDLREGVARGVAMAALALGQHGDMVVTSRGELDAAMGDTGGRHSVRR